MPEYVLDVSLDRNRWNSLDEFTRGYLEAVMWLLSDEYRECDACGFTARVEFEVCPECDGTEISEVTDEHPDVGAHDISDEMIASAVADCRAFQETFRADLDEATDELGRGDASHGHDFYLTRNRHGAGFWDRGYSPELSRRLTDGAHAYGETHHYVGDDGKVYGE